MIIWLDGTHGVGKTSVAEAIKERCPQSESLDSDVYWNDFLEKNCLIGGGCFPQNNKPFIERFKHLIEEKMQSGCAFLIVQMALTEKECKERLFDCLKEAYENTFHIILTAEIETLISRIKSDSDRDQQFALSRLKWNTKFLGQHYSDAARIVTDNKSISDIVDEIFANCNLKTDF
ncbi:hypothetical protein D7V91_00295 [bacterium 1xD42-67]|nr:hypothetical protein D7V91_00295 [bacterium 1xD42-67]